MIVHTFSLKMQREIDKRNQGEGGGGGREGEKQGGGEGGGWRGEEGDYACRAA